MNDQTLTQKSLCQKSQLISSILKSVEQDPTLMLNYAKRTCKKCWGKGYNEVGAVGQKELYKQLCDCALKNIKKEATAICG